MVPQCRVKTCSCYFAKCVVTLLIIMLIGTGQEEMNTQMQSLKVQKDTW